MSWTWTGYDYDPVFRYKEEATFFQTGRNNAEARFLLDGLVREMAETTMAV